MLLFRKTYFTVSREVVIDNMIENIVATDKKTSAGIFYLVVRRPMLHNSYNILEISILRRSIFHNTGDNFLCSLHIAASTYEILVGLSYIIRPLGIPRQTDYDDDGRMSDDDDYL